MESVDWVRLPAEIGVENIGGAIDWSEAACMVGVRGISAHRTGC